ncbi:MAG: Protein TolB [Acidobacteria bacterium]|nr:Protein TolB [Acidobacteriota bacterium]
MTPDRWRQVEEIFHAALDRAPGDRAAFLDEACKGDPALRKEAENLLASFDDAGDFIEAPLVSDSLSSSAQTKSILGHKIGNYEILRLLGAGGMGEVYLARDVRLDRQIALKILPAQFTEDPAQVRRFEREARAASSTNHPNIITIHDIGVEGGAHFIATEYIAGRTLREIIADGKMALREALEVGSQIASALAAAHAAGIVHRDIKPENVMARPDGLVKVLDFGLAKPIKAGAVSGNLRWPEAVNPYTDPWPQTDPRMLMGTLAYLSPEQARGEEIDHRTDIFSLGVVIYEMIACARPFKGETAAAILDAILKQEPEPIAIGELSGELNRVIGRALEKDREARYQNASDLRDDLQRLARHLEAEEGRADRQRISPRWLTKAAALAAVIAVSIALWLVWRAGISKTWDLSSPRPSPWIDAVSVNLTGFPGHEIFPSLAPDGRSFVYSRHLDNQYDIFVQRVGEMQARNLTADSKVDDWMAAFAPDGSRIAFRSERDGGGVFVMNADGGNLRRLTQGGFNPAWSPGGDEIVYATSPANSPHSRGDANSQLWVVNVTTGEQRRIDTGSGKDAVQPSWSPSGARIAYWGLRGTHRDIWTVPSRGGEPAAVTNDEATDWNPVWSPDGKYLYFASDSHGAMRFWRAPIDQTTGQTLGEREAVTGSGAESWHPSFSRDGKRLAYVNYIVKENILRFEFDPQREIITGQQTPITGGARRVTAPELSPNGQWLAYYTFGSPQEDIFIVRQDGSEPRQLTNDRFRDRVPRWSPDGKRIAFYSDRSGGYEIWIINSDGSGLRRLTECGDRNCFYPAWSQDGTRLAFYKAGVNTFIVESDKQWAEQRPQALPAMPGADGHFELWSWSGDGRMLAGVWRGGKSPGVFTYSLATQRYERITSFGSDPVWLSDNRRLLFIHKFRLYLVDSRARQPREILSLGSLRISLAAPARDDRQIYLSVISPESDIQMLSLK